MSDGRAYLLRVWQLAEELAVQSRQPLHAFLLLHHVLTQPPPPLRRINAAGKASTTSSPASGSAATAVAAAPLHLASLDAEWKCEELATRVRAAEYLLNPDAPPPARATAAEAASAASSPRTLSRAAALESLELAEQVLAPVFAAASSHTSSTHTAMTPSNGLETSLDEVACTTASAGAGRAASAMQPSSSSSHAFRGGGVTQTRSDGAVSTRGTSMYFFNESTVAALTWPLSAFSLVWPFGTDAAPVASSSAVAPASSLLFKAANQTIMIAVALVVRAHVLQAVVCHRRVQYKRALQCLSEARRWVQHQFTPSAQQRSLRLLRADLQERWSGAETASSMSSSTPLLPQQLPGFDRVMNQLMELERRACETMISVEECKVHLMVLQACGTVPPPPLLHCHVPPLPPSAGTASFSYENDVGDGGGGGGPPVPHAPDLRLHYKRYHESVQQLHQVSRVYMHVIKWIEEEEEDDEHVDEHHRHRVRVKVETKDEDKEMSYASVSMSREHVRRVQSQLSPFCLCALRRQNRPPSSPAAPPHPTATLKTEQGRVEEEEESYASSLRPSQKTSAADFSSVPVYAVTYDRRLAAEVLGWYHCVSFLYILSQHAPATPMGSSAAQARDERSAHADEAEFFAHYAGAWPRPPLASQPHASPSTSTTTTPTTTTATMGVAAALCDPVQRARAHFRAFALIFGAFPPPNEADTRWCARLGSCGASPSPAHEAALLFCLAELALGDNFPMALTFCSGFHERLKASPAVKIEEKGEEATADDPCKTSRKRSRVSPLAPPPSWHWVRPGVRAILHLYVELMTVLMQAAATTHTSTPPPSPPASSTTAAVRLAGLSPTPSVPVLQAGLQRAEQVLARLLFALDREMLHLTGNAWGMAPASSASLAAHPRGSSVGVAQTDTSQVPRTQDELFASTPAAPWRPQDQLQSSSPAQLRWLVQLKAAALLVMARHHLTQLSFVRAVHHLREVQQFTRVFQRQAKLTLMPEMHVLLAAVATCMSLRRLPDQRQGPGQRHPQRDTAACATSLSEGEERQEVGSGVCGFVEDDNSENEETAETPRFGSHEADSHGEAFFFSFARGWPLAEAAVFPSPPPSSASTPLYSISPQEEAIVGQDVGLPYLHLLAAERAACTSLHTPPSFVLLLYLMKAWAVYQLVAAGEEMTWATPAVVSDACEAEHPLLQQQQQQQGSAPVSPVSPAGPPHPLPTASFATTTLNSTVEDQQRRVARLDSLTSTPTGTPTLRSRHASLPAEMQRIHLDHTAAAAAVAASPPVLSPVAANASLMPSLPEEEARRGDAPASTRAAPSAAPLTCAAAVATRNETAAASDLLSPPCRPLPPPVSLTAAVAVAQRPPRRQSAPQPRLCGARVSAVPLTVRHRAGDVLQRMMAVLRHHYDGYCLYLASASSSSTSPPAEPATVPTAAWTPQNVTLFRLLRGAVLLTEDRDEPAAARELKETTHYAKQQLGVLHPFVADGLAMLTRAYASLDVDTVPRAVAPSSEGGTQSAPPPHDGASRTRRVAVQLAMRCSCTALASLAMTDVASAHAMKPPAASDKASERPAAPTAALGDPASINSHAMDDASSRSGIPPPQLALVQSRLREWWTTQVLGELCGSGSAHRSSHALEQLRVLFGWLPGCGESGF